MTSMAATNNSAWAIEVANQMTPSLSSPHVHDVPGRHAFIWVRKESSSLMSRHKWKHRWATIAHGCLYLSIVNQPKRCSCITPSSDGNDDISMTTTEVLSLNYGHIQYLGHDAHRRAFVFQLTVDLWTKRSSLKKSMRSFLFATSSQHTVDQWMEAISNNIVQPLEMIPLSVPPATPVAASATTAGARTYTTEQSEVKRPTPSASSTFTPVSTSIPTTKHNSATKGALALSRLPSFEPVAEFAPYLMASADYVKEVLSTLYQGKVGFGCLTAADRVEEERTGSSLLYGEVLREGVTRLMDGVHLRARDAKIVYDLGGGIGKLAVQTWLQFPNVQSVVGVELAFSRFRQAQETLARLATDDKSVGLHSVTDSSILISCPQSRRISLSTISPTLTLLSPSTVPPPPPPPSSSTTDVAAPPAVVPPLLPLSVPPISPYTGGRTIEFRRGNLFDTHDVTNADIIIMETLIPDELGDELAVFLSTFKKGCRLLTFSDIRPLWDPQLLINQMIERAAAAAAEQRKRAALLPPTPSAPPPIVTAPPPSVVTVANITPTVTATAAPVPASSTIILTPLPPSTLSTDTPSTSTPITIGERKGSGRLILVEPRADTTTSSSPPPTIHDVSIASTVTNIASMSLSSTPSTTLASGPTVGISPPITAEPTPVPAPTPSPSPSPPVASSTTTTAVPPPPPASRVIMPSGKEGALMGPNGVRLPFIGLKGPCPYRQLPVNVSPTDRFMVTWNRKIGHHFYLWEKIA